MKNRLILIGMIVFLSSCCHLVVAPPVALPMPADRLKPRIPASEVSCLTPEVKRKLIVRDATWEAELNECKAIIRSTHDEP